MLVWTICTFRKPSMGEDEFHRYMSEKHAPLVREALIRHGITRYSMTHFTTETRSLLDKATAGHSINDEGYDLITQIQFPSIQCFESFNADPYYKENVMPDHDIFTDPERIRMSIGWVEDHIVDGEIMSPGYDIRKS